MITTHVNAFSCCDEIKVWNETKRNCKLDASKKKCIDSFSPDTLNY